MMKTKISVIVPIYNTSKFLVRCLDSILNQTEREIEVLLIDDGSTDNSKDICLEYCDKNSVFKYFFKTNGGLSSARNYGIERASGNYIFFLDSDDYLPPHALKICYNTAENYQVDLLNFGYTYVKGEQHDHRHSIFPKNQIFSKDTVLDLLKHDTLKNKLLWFSWTYFYKSEFLKPNSLIFDESILLGEDSVFNMKCLLKAKSIYSIEDSLYYYIHNENSLTQAKFRLNLIEKFETQFVARKRVYEEHGILEAPYITDFSQNYLEHVFFEIVLNEYNNQEASKADIINNIKKLRDRDFMQFALRHYKPSNNVSKGKLILIKLFKFRLFILFDILFRSRT